MQELNSVEGARFPPANAHILRQNVQREPQERIIWCAPAAPVSLLTNGYDWAGEIRFSGEFP